jgi:hypothetical protein
MKPLTDRPIRDDKGLSVKEIRQKLEINCQRELDKIEQNSGGVPGLRLHLVHDAATAAKGYYNFFTEKHWETVRGTAREYRALAGMAKKFSNRIDNLRGRGLQIDGLPEELQARSWKIRSAEIGRRLRKMGRTGHKVRGQQGHDPAIIVMLSTIFLYQKDFKCWEYLSRVLAEAYLIVGRPDAATMTADKLQRAAKKFFPKNGGIRR